MNKPENFVNPNNLPGTITPQEATESLQKLQEEKAITQAINGPKSAYLKALVYKHHEIWWNAIKNDMQSDDPDIRAKAMVEFNKLQCRVLPTEFSSPEGEGIVIKVQNFTREREEEETTE